MLNIQGSDAWCKVPMVFGYGKKNIVVKGFNGSAKVVGILNIVKFEPIELMSIFS